VSTFALLVRNLFYHWRGNLAVLLGILLGSAVLTGALLVGDSLRGSLQALTLEQLGWIDEAMLPGRFFRAELAQELSAKQKSAALMLQGSAARTNSSGETDRVGSVTVLGVDATFWLAEKVPEGTEFWSSDAREVVLNRTLADALGAKVGEMVTLRVQKADAVPGETLMGKRKFEDATEPLEVKVRQILPDDGMARFSLRPTPQPVRNAFVPIGTLHKHKDLDVAGRANALFVAGGSGSLEGELRQKLTLDDWGLRFRSPRERAEAFFHLLAGHSSELIDFRWQGRVPPELAALAVKKRNREFLTEEAVIKFFEQHRNYWALESKRMILEPFVVAATQKLAEQTHGWDLTELSIYLADSMSDGRVQTPVPYAIVAGVGSSSKAPLLPVPPLKEDEAGLVTWPGSPLQATPGKDALSISYYVPDEKNRLVLKDAKFKVAAVLKLEGPLDDPDLTPEFPGVTDKLDMLEWTNPPFPYDKKRIKEPDNAFWKRYRTTPRAYINLDTAKKLWGSRFGDLTAILLTQKREPPSAFPAQLLAQLKPEQGGFVFQPVRAQAIHASSGTTPFGVLFLAFSIFLIVSALLLVGLLVRLNLDRRATEMGVLLAIGWDNRQVRRLLLGEGALLAAVGSALGLAGAIVYARLMLRLLAANWPGGEHLNFLRLHTEPASFAIGYVSALLVSVLTLVWATRVLGKLSPRSLLMGETLATGTADGTLGWSRWLIPAGVIGALVLAVLGALLPSQEAQAGSFFTSGALLLTAALAAVWNGLKLMNRGSSPEPSLTLLALRNAGRHLVRSVLTVGLLASASFVIVAVESFHKEADDEFLKKTGGSGGFAFYGESSMPIFEDLNQTRSGSHEVVFYPCWVQPGDDASCLNLYKPLQPRVMAFSDALIERGGFHFADSIAKTKEEKDNPWLLLRGQTDEALPAIIDANTAQWILNVNLGDTIAMKNADGALVKLRIVGLLQESMFQSEVLVSEANFLKLYPRQEGFSFFLIDAGEKDPHKLPALQKQLNGQLGELGIEVNTTASRLEGYLAVENMYLATFQALGGLGLVLGAAGLAIVLLRGVWERRAELALLQALGFRPAQLAWLVLAENVFLLLLGLAAGTVSALLAVAPHLIGMGAQVLWVRIGVLLLLVLAVGLLAAALAVLSTLRTPVLTALRRE
jgi:ABC-type lipoprotein release transport system permease subunit